MPHRDPRAIPQSIRDTVRSRLLVLLANFGGLATGLGFVGTWWWPLELLSHFRVQYLFGLLVLAAGLADLGGPRSAGIALLLAGLNGMLILPLYLNPDPPAERRDSGDLRVMFVNVNASNHNHQQAIAEIEVENPDVVVVLEVTPAWSKALSALDERYPHRASRPRSDNFGIALYSKLEPANLEIRSFGLGLPSVVAELNTEGGLVTLIGTHPPPPMGARMAAERDRALLTVADLVVAHPGAILVGGDFNTTSWSPIFSALIDRSKLRDSRQGFGVQPSWPDGAGLMRIPIDHCLVSRELLVLDRRVGRSIGSDHLPITLDLRFGRWQG